MISDPFTNLLCRHLNCSLVGNQNISEFSCISCPSTLVFLAGARCSVSSGLLGHLPQAGTRHLPSEWLCILSLPHGPSPFGNQDPHFSFHTPVSRGKASSLERFLQKLSAEVVTCTPGLTHTSACSRLARRWCGKVIVARFLVPKPILFPWEAQCPQNRSLPCLHFSYSVGVHWSWG